MSLSEDNVGVIWKISMSDMAIFIRFVNDWINVQLSMVSHQRYRMLIGKEIFNFNVVKSSVNLLNQSKVVIRKVEDNDLAMVICSDPF